MKIGFIGLGVVGGAVYAAFNQHFECRVYDPAKGFTSFSPILETDIVFVAVPTPTKKNGVQDQTALRNVLHLLTVFNYLGIVVIKSTVLPGATQAMKQAHDLDLVHNPEFLTEKSPIMDFHNQPAILLSGPSAVRVANIYDVVFPRTPKHCYSDYETTEMAKYMHNCFLALKVSFFNEVYTLCEAGHVDYNMSLQAALSQERIAANHTKVPGPDGKYGFGGSCFPKDTLALVKRARTFGKPIKTLEAAIKVNKKNRR